VLTADIIHTKGKIPMKKLLLFPSLLSIAVVAVLFIPHANARGGTFLIQPKQEIVEEVDPFGNIPPFGVAGRISASSSIDFYVTSPSGGKLLSYIATNDTNFSFTEQENGTYEIHLANTHSTGNVTVVLTYGLVFETTSSLNINVGLTSQSSTVTPAPPLPPPDSPDSPDKYDPYANYLNFLKASQILRDSNENLQRILPINKLPLAVMYNMLVMYTLGAAGMQLHRIVGRTLRITERKNVNLSLMEVK
jgi:hypothetical protein